MFVEWLVELEDTNVECNIDCFLCFFFLQHWDWFEECYEDEWDAAPFSPNSSSSSSSSKAKKPVRFFFSFALLPS